MKKILLKVSGSIAAFKAAAFASKAVQAGYDVRVVLSDGAREFVGAATFEGITRERVYSSTFAPGDAMAHIDLARWADLTIVYPASANTLTKLAAGRADDLTGTLFLAHDFKSPYWVAPAMNPSMYGHPAVSDSVQKLRAWGVEILDPDSGRMACGEVGSGRLVEPEALLSRVADFLKQGIATRMVGEKNRVVISAGGTVEEIDPVRVLTNVSTGETGIRIANQLSRNGNPVTLLLAEGSPFRSLLDPEVEVVLFRTFDDLDLAVKSALKNSDVEWFIHSAAVSDYSVEQVLSVSGKPLDRESKIQSQEGMILHLTPNPKILERVRNYSANPKIKILSFKLSTHPVEGRELETYSSDYVVTNVASAVERGSDRHGGIIFSKKTGRFEKSSVFATKSELCEQVNRIIRGEVGEKTK
ncbi:MAG: bifunctional phosphopantothenoylcysteine decarboxylase/phosphopantothenate--cysteine ligase CoaBC [Cryobacterium sp.]|nr:bifunctional phosphopantothenoylcysteine decarboxylase/phosphopantothenate--cysteine ligase CoaBC [Oligoflexia bacterium]